MKQSVALIYGGKGFEREVSLSGSEFVLPLINKEKYIPIPIFISEDGRWLICRKHGNFYRPEKEIDSVCAAIINCGDYGGLLAYGEIIRVDIAFPLLHGDFGEDGVVQGALANANIPYIGENLFVSALCLDKVFTRKVAEGLLIPGADWYSFAKNDCIEDAEIIAKEKIGYPMFIKPRALGSSVGIGRANNHDEFILAFSNASGFGDGRVLVESFIDIDCELEIGVLRKDGGYVFTGIGKISNSKGFYDYNEKYSYNSAAAVDPSPIIDAKIEDKIRSFSTLLVSAIEIRSLARIDFFLSKGGEIYFNEINTMPGFTAKSLYPSLVSRVGIPPEELIDILIKGARV